jgi:hypothetical protein
MAVDYDQIMKATEENTFKMHIRKGIAQHKSALIPWMEGENALGWCHPEPERHQPFTCRWPLSSAPAQSQGQVQVQTDPATKRYTTLPWALTPKWPGERRPVVQIHCDRLRRR